MAKPKSRVRRPFLTLENATFRLGDRLIFEKISWALQRDEQWAVIGPNGSGKSIFADALRGRVPLVHGELRYHFRTPSGFSPEEFIGHVAFEDRKSEVQGAVVQSRWTSFEEEGSLRVREFLSYDRVMDVNPFEISSRHGAGRREFAGRLRRAMRLLQIEPYWPRTVLSLSNGERQRVQLARALAQPLRLLILDDPYVGLDRSMREHFHQFLERLLKTKLRVLLLTTRAEDLPKHITHILYVEGCRVVAAGPRVKILGRESATRRCFLGDKPPANRNVFRRSDGTKRSFSRPGIDSSRASKGQGGAKLVELRQVTVRYGANTILSDVNWTVQEGESWALVGRNGAGKTTLLSLIQGDNPQAYVNHVEVFGRRRGTGESIWELKKRIGWVSPELQLHFDGSVTVLEAVLSGFEETIGLYVAPGRAQVAAARQWLVRFGLMKWAQAPLFSLSVGLQRMTLLARAMVKLPRLLILDEPCQGLDQGHRQLVLRNVEELIRAGRVTVLFVTHRPEEIPASIKHVLRLSKARYEALSR